MMTRKKGTLGSFEQEVDDVLATLKRKGKADFEKKRRIKMTRTREWAKRFGKSKTPKWKSFEWSHQKKPILLHKGWYSTWGFATRVRVTTDKHGRKKYWLDLYDSVAKSFR